MVADGCEDPGMRQLLPTAADSVDLPEAYAYPVDGRWVRANMVASLDGSAVKHGRSGGLGGPADKQVFGVLRSLCDAVVVGAGTARAEGYRAPRAKDADAERRRRHGQLPAPVLVLVSRGLGLDPASDLFTGTEQTVVLTSESSDPAARDRLSEVADVVVAGDDDVDLAAALDALAARGLRRVLCEGGPSLLADIAAAGRLDELCVTVSPQLVGGDGPRILHGTELDVVLQPALLVEQDGMLLARYVRA
jgi:riboflavin biosynthesis pyrimidine reductase